ncbi:MAG TPA: nucleoside-triphosphatase [Thauera sp.]|nr:nucleoside-triphosphatase [Thauera sp.]
MMRAGPLPFDVLGLQHLRAQRIVIVSGGRGVGKTRFCRALVEAARGAGLVVAGLLSPAVFAEGGKTAIDLTDLASGETRRLAERARADAPGTAGLGWHFDPAALDWGNQVLQAAAASDLLVIDELGPLEFHGQGGLSAGFTAIEAARHRQAIVVVRPELVVTARLRWPGAAVVEPTVGLPQQSH